MFADILGIGALLSGVVGSIFGSNKTTTTTTANKAEDSLTDSTGNRIAQAGEQQLSDPLLNSLESLFSSTLGSGSFAASQNASTQRLNQLMTQAAQPSFDPAAYAADVTRQATANTNFDLEKNINSLLSATGGSESGNSMAALLANRLRTDAAANVAGINAQARATGEQIRQSGESTLNQGIQSFSDSIAGQILSLIEQTKGTRSASTQTTAEQQRQQVQTNTKATSTENTTEKSNPFKAFSDMFAILGNSQLAA